MKKVTERSLCLLLLWSIFWHVSCQKEPGQVRVEETKATEYKLIAHRGVVNDTIIENTLTALHEAIDRGYVMIETDIRFTKDGVPIVHHDDDFERYYGSSQKVADTNAADLKSFVNSTYGFSPLTLQEFVDAAEGKVSLVVDVKGTGHPDPYYERVTEVLQQAGIYESSKVAWSDEARAYFLARGGIKIGIDTDEFRLKLERREDINPEIYFVVENAQDLSAFEAEKAQELGLEVIASLNRWQLRNEDNHLLKAKELFDKTSAAGVRIFLIDAVYEHFFDQ